ncbi:hypothetical protein BDQ17DRAFT_1330046 [Cyathus striatus]|nr:hypothetical protein BDQ17DRAFT_1330046 [Cyathus striatus]
MLSESDTDEAEYEKERLVDEAVELFTDAEDFFTTIQSNFIASSMVEIHGTYRVEDNNDIVDKERIQIVAKEIWRVTGYQFIVWDHKCLMSGHHTQYWCSQDEEHCKKPKPSPNPAAMMERIQTHHPEVTRLQVQTTWKEFSKVHWYQDDEQLPSAKKLLQEYGEEVDVFEPTGVPEGVEMLAWGMKKIAGDLKGKIIEIGIDVTCKW